MTNVSGNPWWAARRLRYNIGLVVSGVTAFVCYALVIDRFTDRFPDAEITLFTTLFQGIGYLVAMGIANLCYFLGPLLERHVPRERVATYRIYAYSAGCGFSFSLPFLIPLLVLVSALTTKPIAA